MDLPLVEFHGEDGRGEVASGQQRVSGRLCGLPFLGWLPGSAAAPYVALSKSLSFPESVAYCKSDHSTQLSALGEIGLGT